MIRYHEDNCIGCNSCIRVCPIHGANVSEVKEDGTIGINVNQNSCIKCGACIKTCEHNARSYDDDTERFFADLQKGNEIAVIVAPAVKVAFDGYWRHVLSWLKSKGVKYIYDVSLGADICTWAHLRYVKKNPGKKIISQPCAAIVNYVEIHNPDLIPHMSPVQSPMLCTAIYLRKKIGRDIKIAALSPCIAKKDEFIETGLVEYNVTFNKVAEYIKNNNITLPNISNLSSQFSEFEFDYMQGTLGAVYPSPAGLKENLKYHAPELSVINAEGTRSIYQNLDNYLTEKRDSLPAVFDVLSCSRGCNGGPAVGKKYSVFHIETIMHDVDTYVTKNYKHGPKSIKGLFRKFDRELTVEEFCRTYKNKKLKKYMPTAREVDAVFNSIGKKTKADRSYNCHACGYKSCEELAIAIASGISTKESCMKYASYLVEENAVKIKEMLHEFELIASDLVAVVDELNRDVGYVKADADQINVIGDECNVDMDKISDDIGELTALAVNIQEAMAQINDSVEGYKDMTANVDDIASQINLLSVNANIEAVRAGAVGKGFSVIATEIRKLAQHSQESVVEADDCNKEINSAVDNITNIVKVINDTVKMLTDSVNKMKIDVNESTERGKSINNYMQDVASVTERISRLVDKTNSISIQ